MRNQYKILAEKYITLKESEVDYDSYESIFDALYNSKTDVDFLSIVKGIFDYFYSNDKVIRDLEDYVQVKEEALEPVLNNAIGYVYWSRVKAKAEDDDPINDSYVRYKTLFIREFKKFKEYRDAKENLAKQNKETGINLDI